MMRKYWLIGGGLLSGILLLNLIELSSPALPTTTPDPNYAKAVLAARKQKDDFLRSDTTSPLLPLDKLNFIGLDYFPVNPTLRIPARYEASPATGTEQGGTLVFDFGGKNYRLLAKEQLREGRRSLFVAFRDATSSKSTYPGGRYVELALEDPAKLVLDFNFSYHPYCVYNPTWVCPAVPPENRLGFAVEAGERGYAGSSVKL
jgi:uncharacterized protein